jgi:hypothetical protein
MQPSGNGSIRVGNYLPYKVPVFPSETCGEDIGTSSDQRQSGFPRGLIHCLMVAYGMHSLTTYPPYYAIKVSSTIPSRRTPLLSSPLLRPFRRPLLHHLSAFPNLSEGISINQNEDGKEGEKEEKVVPLEFVDVVVERKMGKIWADPLTKNHPILTPPKRTSRIQRLLQIHINQHLRIPPHPRTGGLRCMGRNQVHFATGPAVEDVLAGNAVAAPGQVISGMRRDAQVLIYVDLEKALNAG